MKAEIRADHQTCKLFDSVQIQAQFSGAEKGRRTSPRIVGIGCLKEGLVCRACLCLPDQSSRGKGLSETLNSIFIIVELTSLVDSHDGGQSSSARTLAPKTRDPGSADYSQKDLSPSAPLPGPRHSQRPDAKRNKLMSMVADKRRQAID
jgi:hypothetical protein